MGEITLKLEKTNSVYYNAHIQNKEKDGIMGEKKHSFGKFLLVLIILLAIAAAGLFGYYKLSLGPVSKNDEEVIVTIDKGLGAYDIAEVLEKSGAIRSAVVFKLYVKQNNLSGFKSGTYKLNKNMDIDTIIAELQKGSDYYPDNINLTFPEGKNMRWIAKYIASKTSITEEEVIAKQADTAYLDTLIEKYWFLTNDIKDPQILYPLEGYLFPNTYNFEKDVKIETIFTTMLDETDKNLKPLKADIEAGKYTIHKYLTMASIVELEASPSQNRPGVAGVFYNRLSKTMSLGSDVTTYYGLGLDLDERNLKMSEIMQANAYNTRSVSMVGKLPVGPICNPSISSIKAAIYPEKTDYLYFVADKNGKLYFTKSETEHNAKIKELKQQGLWFEYDN
jgi:UPF0755 protein